MNTSLGCPKLRTCGQPSVLHNSDLFSHQEALLYLFYTNANIFFFFPTDLWRGFALGSRASSKKGPQQGEKYSNLEFFSAKQCDDKPNETFAVSTGGPRPGDGMLRLNNFFNDF